MPHPQTRLCGRSPAHHPQRPTPERKKTPSRVPKSACRGNLFGVSAQAKKGSHSNIGHIPSAIDSQMQRKDAQGIFLASELCFHTLLQKELGTKAISVCQSLDLVQAIYQAAILEAFLIQPSTIFFALPTAQKVQPLSQQPVLPMQVGPGSWWVP